MSSQALVQTPDSYVVEAINRWSAGFFKLTLPSGLGKRAMIKQCADEDAKVLAMGVYMAQRTALLDAVPYDGSTYEGHAIKDETSGTLWNYETRFPDGFQETAGESFNVSLGHVYKCSECRGQGRIRCSSCNGRVRWEEKRGEKLVTYTCNCGDGKMDCHTCTGYGTMLKVLKVSTRYKYEEKKAKEYSGKLPEQLLFGSQGKSVYCHVAELDRRVITEAIDGFDTEDYNRLMNDVRTDLKKDIKDRVAGQLTNPLVLERFIDGYFREMPSPVASNKRLSDEVPPVRLRCDVTDVPVKSVTYEYKGKSHSVYVYGNDGRVWPLGKQPVEFTWKILVILGLISVICLITLMAIMTNGT